MDTKKSNTSKNVCDLLSKLTLVHDYCFTSEKKEKAKKLGDEILKKMEESRDTKEAYKLYVKGFVELMTYGDISSAERMLSKALKLDPSNVDAWNTLGTVFWKKGDLVQAKRCFEGGNERQNNKVSQREMSMLIRDSRMVKSQGKATQMELAKRRIDNIKESIELAKSAVSLDVKDSRSWYYVGNAYLTQFFDVSKSIEDLERALRAYVYSYCVPSLGKSITSIYIYQPKQIPRLGEMWRGREKSGSTLQSWKRVEIHGTIRRCSKKLHSCK